MLRYKLINRLTYDGDSIRNPSRWIAGAVRDAMREADKERFQKTDWGHNYLEQQRQSWQRQGAADWSAGGWRYGRQ